MKGYRNGRKVTTGQVYLTDPRNDVRRSVESVKTEYLK